MIDLYYWPTPNGRKITIMLEECDLEYKTIPVDIGKGDQFEAEFLRISPNNRMPAIIDRETGVSVFEPDSGRVATDLAKTRVRMATLDSDRTAWYVATGEPMDKAGSYAVQGLGAVFVEAIAGNYTNVVGLPLPLVSRLLSKLGHDLWSWRR